MLHAESSNTALTNTIAMAGTVLVEIVGLKNAECCPFPCDENRTCGLTGCYPSGKLDTSYEELKKVLNNEYGTRVETKLTIIDNGTPEYIRSIIEAEYPPLPMILINGRITRIGRISLDRIKKEIEKIF
ncbi:MAG TPA: hypothetical protein VJ350_08380 [Methanoregula sp.]|nr:hypothetical protein [Methanoregula sp.]